MAMIYQNQAISQHRSTIPELYMRPEPAEEPGTSTLCFHTPRSLARASTAFPPPWHTLREQLTLL